MTNSEIDLQSAIEALESGKLNSREADFINQIRDYDKKKLRSLTSKQYAWLRDISNKK